MMVVQVDAPCPSCGSYYREDSTWDCNICGTNAPVGPAPTRPFFAGKRPTGKVWSKKLHRFIRSDEIADASLGAFKRGPEES